MTPTQASKVLGIDVSQVRRLIRSKTLKAKKVEIPGGYYYNISEDSVKKEKQRRDS